ncbi:hypothetical protein FVEN_g3860 [Fusarium venenatum]|nr:hypothetical protein FVEN_g3860 [Fusarium venenatum]
MQILVHQVTLSQIGPIPIVWAWAPSGAQQQQQQQQHQQQQQQQQEAAPAVKPGTLPYIIFNSIQSQQDESRRSNIVKGACEIGG